MNIAEIMKAQISHESKGAVRYLLGTPVIIVESSFEIDNQYNGERLETYLIYGMSEYSEEQVVGLLADKGSIIPEGTFCQHEHDCCGCYYANSVDVVKVGKKWLVEQCWSQNV